MQITVSQETIRDLEAQLEEEERARQKMVLEKAAAEQRVKQLEQAKEGLEESVNKVRPMFRTSP